MAIEKFKLAFLALAFACFVQNGGAAPLSSEKSSMPRELEVVGHAVAEIAKSLSELVKSLGAIMTTSLAEGMAKHGLPVYVRAHLMFTASGVQDTSLTLSGEQQLEYRVVASAVLQLRQKLDLMELFEETFNSILADMAAATLANPEKEPAALSSSLILRFSETADRRLRQHPELREAYLRIRDSVLGAEVSSVSLDFSKMSSYAQSLPEILPESVRTKMLTMMVNKQFLHHTLNRVTIMKKEYFVMARSTLELAKKRNKADMVQEVYDKTLRQASLSLDVFKSDVFDAARALFKELSGQFEANPSLNQEWREVQKYVSQRHQWDRNIWDWDWLPF